MLDDLRLAVVTARKRLPDVYWTVWIGTFVNRLGGFVSPLLTFYLIRERDLSVDHAGLIVSTFGAGQVAGSLVGGALSDHIGRRPTLLLSLFGGAAMMLSLGLATSLPAIAISTFMLGVVGEAYRPAVAALVADVVPEKDRLYAYGLLYWVVNLGFAGAPVLAGLVASFSYFALFAIDAFTMAAYGIIVWRRVPETRPTVPATHAAAPAIRLTDVLGDRTFFAFAVLTFGQALILLQLTSSLTAHMSGQGHSEAAYGAVLAINGVLIVLLQPWITRRLAGVDRPRVLALAAVTMGFGFFLHAPSSFLGMHAMAIAVWTLAEIAHAPTASAVVAGLATAGARGRYQGVFTMSWGLATFVAPIVGTRVLASAGPWVLFSGCLALGVAVGAGVLLWAPAYRRRIGEGTEVETPRVALATD